MLIGCWLLIRQIAIGNYRYWPAGARQPLRLSTFKNECQEYGAGNFGWAAIADGRQCPVPGKPVL